MKNNEWKIIVSVLVVVLILSWVFFLWIASIGLDDIRAEEECSNYCWENNGFSFEYDSVSKLCNCYDTYGNIFLYNRIG